MYWFIYAESSTLVESSLQAPMKFKGSSKLCFFLLILVDWKRGCKYPISRIATTEKSRCNTWYVYIHTHRIHFVFASRYLRTQSGSVYQIDYSVELLIRMIRMLFVWKYWIDYHYHQFLVRDQSRRSMFHKLGPAWPGIYCLLDSGEELK